ncbi:MAG: T9SS type A sorting domain-containing protein [Bacteroidota bacterium]
MKYISLTFLLITSLVVTANRPTLYGNLQRINVCWNTQKDIEKLPIYSISPVPYSETNLIQLHLKLVEQVLRNRSTAGLSFAQKRARLQNLNNLHQYWTRNVYPVNNKVAWRNPVFIDDYNTFCAVGYLIKTSGHEQLARKISATQNLSFIKTIKAEGLNEWIVQSGLTLDELAWIQPAYMATNHSRGLSKGVNGPVYAMTGNDVLRTLYVAGSFSQANDAVSCNNIIEVRYDESNLFNNTFHTLGAGLNGPVHALTMDGMTLYAGGHFSSSGSTSLQNIARWNGNAWEAMGNLNGTVYAIHKYKNQIYAGGKFSFSAGAGIFHNLAMWNGSMWLPVCTTLNDTVFSMYADGNRLYIGGAFTSIDMMQVNHIAAYNGFSFEKLGNGVKGTVRTMTILPNHHVIAAGDLYTAQQDTFGYAEYAEQTGWLPPPDDIRILTYMNQEHGNRFYSISEDIMVGNFRNGTSMYYSYNTARINAEYRMLEAFASTDNSVYCVYKTGKRVFFGGSFHSTGSSPANNLAVWDKDFVSVNDPLPNKGTFSVFPNPILASTEIQSAIGIQVIKVFDINGKLVYEKQLLLPSKQYTLERNLFPEAGIYILSIGDKYGNLSSRKLVVN